MGEIWLLKMKMSALETEGKGILENTTERGGERGESTFITRMCNSHFSVHSRTEEWENRACLEMVIKTDIVPGSYPSRLY